MEKFFRKKNFKNNWWRDLHKFLDRLLGAFPESILEEISEEIKKKKS